MENIFIKIQKEKAQFNRKINEQQRVTNSIALHISE